MSYDNPFRGSMLIALHCEPWFAGRVVTKKSGKLVTTCHVRILLKCEVLGSRNAKGTNNLHGRLSEGSHVKG